MRYGFYPGCSYKSSAGYKESVEAVNRELGIDFDEIQDWNCCGATTIFSLNNEDALLMVGRIVAIANSLKLKEIVTVCNACYTTIRKAKNIFESLPETIEPVNKRLASEGLKLEQTIPVRHYLEILANDIAEDVWRVKRKRNLSSLRVAAYYGCQLTRPWADLDHPERPQILDRFFKQLGFSVVNHAAKTLCCGAAHSLHYSADCNTLISRIIRETSNQGADVIRTLCPMCQFNLDSSQAGIDVPSVPIPYFTQLAGLALGIEPDRLGIRKLLVPLKPVL